MPLIWQAIGATILPNLGGFVGGGITAKEIPRWYKHLKKPNWTPPNYVFGPVWTALYSGMGYASYLVWRDGGGFEGSACLPLALYGSQLALNWAWTPIFFGCHSTKWGFWAILALCGGAAASAVAMYQVNETAGLIMAPYLAWLSYATALAFNIWRNNPDGGKVFPVEEKSK